MKEFDFTTESEQDISLDDILGEFRASAKEPDADALYGALQGAVPSAQRIGTVEKYEGGKRIRLR